MILKSASLLVLLIAVCCCGYCSGSIVRRPSEKPLRCFTTDGVSKCVELEPDEVTDEDSKEIEDPNDVEYGPNGGKLYRMDDDYALECFKNGQCFSVELKDLETTSEPTTPPPQEESKGVFYRHGNKVIECLPDGVCRVVETVDREAPPGGDEDENPGDPPEGYVEAPPPDGKDEYPGGNADEGDHIPYRGAEHPDNPEGDNGDGGLPGEGVEGVHPDERVEGGHLDEGVDGGYPNEGVDGGYPDEGVIGDGGYPGKGDIGDGSHPGEGDIDDGGLPDEGVEGGHPGEGKAICEFQHLEHITGSILLQEEQQSKMKVIGKLHGLREGIHVLTFHEGGDVESPGCTGIGPYKRPVLSRRRRQLDLFRMGQDYMRNAYRKCMRYVLSCKASKLSPRTCERRMNSCVPILKCKRCKEEGDAFTAYDTLADLEESGHFTFQDDLPKNSLVVYADDDGESNFSEEEREQTLNGPDTVVGGSIALSEIPPNQEGQFQTIACCRIEKGGPTIIV